MFQHVILDLFYETRRAALSQDLALANQRK
ncbi:hypothetical protein MPC4_20026 [Methylocella tundrae]|uniref:Uncharacterized protein n=1 Tax=Methylocella tundrae TaxID=227605 RepID=A0A8B6M4U6_METTU|nr:hypothetical protein MPC1_490004 [Methylocella tundrae]VTZ49816.1 hypothetical protein MPC4_20026 [Methylocella tundrae]